MRLSALWRRIRRITAVTEHGGRRDYSRPRREGAGRDILACSFLAGRAVHRYLHDAVLRPKKEKGGEGQRTRKEGCGIKATQQRKRSRARREQEGRSSNRQHWRTGCDAVTFLAFLFLFSYSRGLAVRSCHFESIDCRPGKLSDEVPQKGTWHVVGSLRYDQVPLFLCPSFPFLCSCLRTQPTNGVKSFLACGCTRLAGAHCADTWRGLDDPWVTISIL